jgi:ferredoxin
LAGEEAAVSAPYVYKAKMRNVREWDIAYDPQRHKVERLVGFLKSDDVSGKRVNVTFKGPYVDAEALIEAAKVCPDLAVRLVSENEPANVQVLEAAGVKGFLDRSCGVPTSFKLLEAMVFKHGMGDTYIGGELLHDVPAVSELCRKRGVRLRCVLDSVPYQTDAEGLVCWRPNDMDLYLGWFDVFEFDMPHGGFSGYMPRVHNAECDIWFRDMGWNGPLNEVVPDFPYPWDNRSMDPRHMRRRYECGHTCDGCGFCESSNGVAEKLTAKGIGNRG